MPHPHYQQPEPAVGSISGEGHYAAGIYSHALLRRHAEWFLRHKDGIEHDFVVVTGKSGMSVAFAALAVQDFNLVTVRKDESSHGRMIEGEAAKMGTYIVLDDFIDTGATLSRIENELTYWAAKNGWTAPRCVGALLYNQHEVLDEPQVARWLRLYDR